MNTDVEIVRALRRIAAALEEIAAKTGPNIEGYSRGLKIA